MRSVIVAMASALAFALALPGGDAVAQAQPECTHVPATTAWRDMESIHVSIRAEIPIWKTITLGSCKSAKAVREAMDTAPCRIGMGDWADEILGRPAFPFSKTQTELDLIVLSGYELGFGDDGASLKEIYAQAIALGLELCPAEVGPVLRLQYLTQPLREFLHIAMKPIALYTGELVDFTVGNSGTGLSLIGGDGRPEVVLPGAVRFVFVRPRPDTITRGPQPRDTNVNDLVKR